MFFCYAIELNLAQVCLSAIVVRIASACVDSLSMYPAVGTVGFGAPVVETFGAGYGTGIVGGGVAFGAPVVETFGAGYGTGIGFGAPSFATAPLVGSISAGLPMTTMAAPTVSMGAPLGTIGSPVVGAGFGYPSTVW